MNKYELLAVGEYLSDYKETLNYDDIISLLNKEKVVEIDIWQPNKVQEGSWVAARILEVNKFLKKVEV